ncbi:VTT domain-containing protein [Bradyrhizobium liaoningense]|uniref:TVP38/TMEM64 family protein n=1 Tax=Bradyrhizobium liaoningense TaxID=43992 RepID=UPI001BA96873|nr:VTT domain-containing protein [Bradyrhizobium liaoningense]MBR0741388.1 VTT domain-containing protein [Bradyrhizobium liaoningense]
MTDYLIETFQRLGQLSVTSGAALALIFVLAALIAFPRTILIVAAGASFGISAAPIILLAGTVGGTLAFLLARHVASDWFRRKLRKRPQLEAIAEAVDKEGWRIVALVRLGAPVPSALQNYLFGLTRIDSISFALATLIFTAPQVLLFTFLGATGRASLLEDKPIELTLLPILVTLAIIALISWRVQKLLSLRGQSEDFNKARHPIR